MQPDIGCFALKADCGPAVLWSENFLARLGPAAEPALAEFGHTMGFDYFKQGLEKPGSIFWVSPLKFRDLFKARLRKWEKPTEPGMRIALVLGDASANSVNRGHAAAQSKAPQEGMQPNTATLKILYVWRNHCWGPYIWKRPPLSVIPHFQCAGKGAGESEFEPTARGPGLSSPGRVALLKLKPHRKS